MLIVINIGDLGKNDSLRNTFLWELYKKQDKIKTEDDTKESDTCEL